MGSVRPSTQLLVTSDSLHSQLETHTAFPEPLEKNPHCHREWPEVVYHLIVLSITTYFSSNSSLLNWGCIFRQQTTIYWHTELPSPGCLSPSPLYHICAVETSTPWKSTLPQVLDRQEAENQLVQQLPATSFTHPAWMHVHPPREGQIVSDTLRLRGCHGTSRDNAEANRGTCHWEYYEWKNGRDLTHREMRHGFLQPIRQPDLYILNKENRKKLEALVKRLQF